MTKIHESAVMSVEARDDFLLRAAKTDPVLFGFAHRRAFQRLATNHKKKLAARQRSPAMRRFARLAIDQKGTPRRSGFSAIRGLYRRQLSLSGIGMDIFSFSEKAAAHEVGATIRRPQGMPVPWFKFRTRRYKTALGDAVEGGRLVNWLIRGGGDYPVFVRKGRGGKRTLFEVRGTKRRPKLEPAVTWHPTVTITKKLGFYATWDAMESSKEEEMSTAADFIITRMLRTSGGGG